MSERDHMPAIATPKPRKRVVQPIPANLSAPEAPMPKAAKVPAPKPVAEPVAEPKPDRAKKVAKKKPKKPDAATPSTDISKSFSVTLSFPADLYAKMTKNAGTYGVDQATFLKMLLKKDVVEFRETFETLSFSELSSGLTGGPTETITHPMRLTMSQYDRIRSELDPLDLRSMSANIADAVLRFLTKKYL